MKLIIAIIEDRYSGEIIKSLMENNIKITKLASTGGFLKTGNTTLLIGTKQEDLDKTIGLIRLKCEEKQDKKTAKKPNVAGANLFVLDVDKYMRV